MAKKTRTPAPPRPVQAPKRRTAAPTTTGDQRRQRLILYALAVSGILALAIVIGAFLLFRGGSANAAAAKKLRIAGADRVVQPYSAAGRVMANLMLKPQVTAFIDVVTSAAGADLRFEELEVPAGWAQAGKTIGELRIRGKTGAVIVAVRKRDGHFETTPDPDLPLEAGDVMIAAGTDEELRALEELFRSAEAIAGR